MCGLRYIKLVALQIHLAMPLLHNKVPLFNQVCIWVETTTKNKVMLTLDDLMKYVHVKNDCKCLNKNAYM